MERKRQLVQAFRLLNKALEAFYEKRYEQAIQLCGESLEAMLPGTSDGVASPEEKSFLFLRTYSSILPAREAEGIAGVFTFFQSRRARFQFRQGQSLPDRDWWQFIRISREEAEHVLQATRLTLNAIESHSDGTGA